MSNTQLRRDRELKDKLKKIRVENPIKRFKLMIGEIHEEISQQFMRSEHTRTQSKNE